VRVEVEGVPIRRRYHDDPLKGLGMRESTHSSWFYSPYDLGEQD
jgi:hypothetical protein